MSISAVSTPAQVGTSNPAVRQHIVDLYRQHVPCRREHGPVRVGQHVAQPELV